MDNIEAADFARAFLKFCELMHHLAPIQSEPVSELLGRAKGHLGIDPIGLPSLKEEFDPSEHQAIILAFQARSGLGTVFPGADLKVGVIYIGHSRWWISLLDGRLPGGVGVVDHLVPLHHHYIVKAQSPDVSLGVVLNVALGRAS